MKDLKLCLIVMAAGISNRYQGDNKLLTYFNGKTLFENTIDKIPLDHFNEIKIVAFDKRILKLAKKHHLSTIYNDDPKAGLGKTIKLGLDGMQKQNLACMFLVCDQPLLTQKTVLDLIDFWSKNQDHICVLAHGENLGNPVIFPNSLFNALLNIKDFQRGNVVIEAHRHLLKKFYIQHTKELFDIDTVQDMEKAKEFLNENSESFQ